MPSTRSQTRRAAPSRTTSAARLTKPASISKSSRPALSRPSAHPKPRLDTAAAAAIPRTQVAPSSSASSSPRQPSFPELVRRRVAYSPAPSHSPVDDAAARHLRRMPWPSQIMAQGAAKGPAPELAAYEALLRGALRKAGESTASPDA